MPAAATLSHSSWADNSAYKNVEKRIFYRADDSDRNNVNVTNVSFRFVIIETINNNIAYSEIGMFTFLLLWRVKYKLVYP